MPLVLHRRGRQLIPRWLPAHPGAQAAAANVSWASFGLLKATAADIERTWIMPRSANCCSPRRLWSGLAEGGCDRRGSCWRWNANKRRGKPFKRPLVRRSSLAGPWRVMAAPRSVHPRRASKAFAARDHLRRRNREVVCPNQMLSVTPTGRTNQSPTPVRNHGSTPKNADTRAKAKNNPLNRSERTT